MSALPFIGYQIQGVWGAIVATVGIFLPSFILILILYPLVPQLRKSTWTAHFLDAVNIGAVGIMLGVTVKLGKEILIDWKTWGIAVLCSVLIFVLKNQMWP